MIGDPYRSNDVLWSGLFYVTVNVTCDRLFTLRTACPFPLLLQFAILATLGILLASGILGALAEFGAADDARSIARDLAALPGHTHTARAAISRARWMWVPKFLTPAVFIATPLHWCSLG